MWLGLELGACCEYFSRLQRTVHHHAGASQDTWGWGLGVEPTCRWSQSQCPGLLLCPGLQSCRTGHLQSYRTGHLRRCLQLFHICQPYPAQTLCIQSLCRDCPGHPLACVSTTGIHTHFWMQLHHEVIEEYMDNELPARGAGTTVFAHCFACSLSLGGLLAHTRCDLQQSPRAEAHSAGKE